MEKVGIEPTTLCMLSIRATNCAISPRSCREDMCKSTNPLIIVRTVVAADVTLTLAIHGHIIIHQQPTTLRQQANRKTPHQKKVRKENKKVRAVSQNQQHFRKQRTSIDS